MDKMTKPRQNFLCKYIRNEILEELESNFDFVVTYETRGPLAYHIFINMFGDPKGEYHISFGLWRENPAIIVGYIPDSNDEYEKLLDYSSIYLSSIEKLTKVIEKEEKKHVHN